MNGPVLELPGVHNNSPLHTVALWSWWWLSWWSWPCQTLCRPFMDWVGIDVHLQCPETGTGARVVRGLANIIVAATSCVLVDREGGVVCWNHPCLRGTRRF